MGKGTKIAVKVKGTPDGVKKALAKIAGAPETPTIRLREADFRQQSKKRS